MERTHGDTIIRWLVESHVYMQEQDMTGDAGVVVGGERSKPVFLNGMSDGEKSLYVEFWSNETCPEFIVFSRSMAEVLHQTVIHVIKNRQRYNPEPGKWGDLSSKSTSPSLYKEKYKFEYDGELRYTLSHGFVDKYCEQLSTLWKANDTRRLVLFSSSRDELRKQGRNVAGLGPKSAREAKKFFDYCCEYKKWGEEAWKAFSPTVLSDNTDPNEQGRVTQVRNTFDGQPPPKQSAETNPIWTGMAEWANGFGLHVAATERPPFFNLILEGVPGTGKTYSLDQLRKKLTEDSGQTGDSQLKDGQKEAAAELGQGRFAMTMHPATAYEDFVEGLRPGAPALPTFADVKPPQAHGYGDENTVWFFTNSANDKPKSNPSQTTGFQVHDGFFVRVCREAVHYPDRVFVVLLDEINRCNIPKVLGDLLTTIEASKRARYDKGKHSWDTSTVQVMTLPYSQRSFFVPDNVVVVGTMNTTDRSVAPMDAALRRRFAFARVYPQGFEYGKTPEKAPADLQTIESSWELWRKLNEYLRQFGEDAMLGHSYLHALASDTKHIDPNVIRSHWNHYIFPQLVDVLVSNDLLDKALGSKDVTDVKKMNYAFPTDSGVNEAAGKVGNLTITVNGKGLLRTPTIRLELPAGRSSSEGDQQKQPEFSGGPSSTTQEIESGGEQAQ